MPLRHIIELLPASVLASVKWGFSWLPRRAVVTTEVDMGVNVLALLLVASLF